MKLAVAAVCALLSLGAGQARAQKVDTIYGGRPAFVVRPFTDTIDIVRVTGAVREPLSTMITTASAEPASELTIRSVTDAVVYTTRVDARTFAPRYSRTQAPTDSAELIFETGRIRGWAYPIGGPLKTTDIQVTATRMPVAAEGTLLRVLPFREGYSAFVRKLDVFSGTEGWAVFRVTGSDTATHRGRVTGVWVVEESTAAGQLIRRYWVSKSSGQPVKAIGLRMRTASSGVWWFYR